MVRKPTPTSSANSPSQLIDARIADLGDWRGETLARVRAIIQKADAAIVEEWKWRGVPVWSDDGIVCTGETYKDVVKLTFAKGAALADPSGLFNASLEGNTRRAIDIREGDKLDAKALTSLIRAAVALNHAKPAKAKPATAAAKPAPAKPAPARPAHAKPAAAKPAPARPAPAKPAPAKPAPAKPAPARAANAKPAPARAANAKPAPAKRAAKPKR